MKTKMMLTAAVFAVFAATARAEMAGVPHEMQFWLFELGAPVIQLNAILPVHQFYWRGDPVYVPTGAEPAEISGLPREVQFWLLEPRLPAAELSIREPGFTTGEATTTEESEGGQGTRSTTGENRRTTEEASIVPHPRPRPKP
jgi:hypothetical protein